MGTTDVDGRRGRDLRSDGVHGLLKTTGMAAAPQFQLQRTSRGWVRRKKKMPSDIIRGAGTGARERRLVNSPFRILLVRLCSSLLPRELWRFVIHPVDVTVDLVGSREGSPVRRL